MPQFANSNNWDLISNGNITASLVNPNEPYHIPINPISISTLIETPTIAIFTETTNPKSTWKCGGWVAANIVSGLIVGGNADTEIARRYLQLEKINIVRFPRLSNNFALKLFVPSWFKYFSWTIWEYIGEGFADLEGKLDNLESVINTP